MSRSMRRGLLYFSFVLFLIAIYWIYFSWHTVKPYTLFYSTDYQYQKNTIDKPNNLLNDENISYEVENFLPQILESKKDWYRPVRATFFISKNDSFSEPSHVYGYDVEASNLISLNREVPEMRSKMCADVKYSKNLPSVSVVLVFHNEGLSTLLRTVHSVIRMSPSNVLKEIVLIDDHSDYDDLKGPLNSHIEHHIRPIIRVILNRTYSRVGLIEARNRGAQLCTSKVVVFLDAHCECSKNWLVPLIQPIAENRETMTVPIVDAIDASTFSISSVYGNNKYLKGIFEWGFFYKETDHEISNGQSIIDPYYSPTHAGGLFAIDVEFFKSLGYYDSENIKIWGGENFELSFKIWMCSKGFIKWVPCSRVSHVYRKFMPYSLGPYHKISQILQNYKFIVDTYMGNYSKYFYRRMPSLYDPDSVTKKPTLECKNFHYFLYNIASSVLKDYPLPKMNQMWGEISINKSCWEPKSSSIGSIITVSGCHHTGGNQEFRLNVDGQLANGERCIITDNGQTLKLSLCEGATQGPWIYNKKQIKHKLHNVCVEFFQELVNNFLLLKECDETNANQLWNFENGEIIRFLYGYDKVIPNI